MFKKLFYAAAFMIAATVCAPAQAASLIYDSFWDDLFHGNITPSSDTVYGMLVTSSYTPSKSAHAKRSDVTSEVSGTGYTTGGAAVTVTVVAAAGNSDQEQLTFSSPAWTSSTITARAIVLYKHRGGSSSADNLYEYIDFGSNIVSTAGTFTATLNAMTLQN